MAAPLLKDDLWDLIKPLLPKRPPRLRGGRPPVDDRDALTGILFVLKSGLQWQDLPDEMGCGSGMTCLRRLRDWQQAGAWERIENLLMQHLREPDRYDWVRAWSRAEPENDRTGGFRQRMPVADSSVEVCDCRDRQATQNLEA